MVVLLVGVGSAEYVDYTPGDINLILTVPHNGNEKPDSNPTRQPGCENSDVSASFQGLTAAPEPRPAKLQPWELLRHRRLEKQCFMHLLI